jgi:protein-tyrosine-phosphatase
MVNILFVCTGNTCRSPMAEGIFRQLIKQYSLEINVRSAGIHTTTGNPISHLSRVILSEEGFQEAISSKSIDEHDLIWADIILTMTIQHKQWIIQNFHEALERTYTLKEYVGDEDGLRQFIEERDVLITNLQLRQTLSQKNQDHENQRLIELENLIPSSDVTDPFGGDIETYRLTAKEIKELLVKLMNKLNNRGQ